MGEPVTLTSPAAARAGQVGSGPAPHGPVVILSYPHAGAEHLARALADSPAVACTQGTGLLPLCHSAISAWRNVEARGAAPSPLAIKSVRTMVTSMAMVIQARTGAARWCETATASPDTAETFLQVYPEATFICVHRRLREVLAEGLRAYPWGLGGSPFWPHSGGHPGNNIATIAAYWAASTESLLEFEERHPGSCLRVRHEDLAADPHGCAAGLCTSLGLDPRDLILPGHRADGGSLQEQPVPDHEPEPAADRELPITAQVPPQLLARIRDLHASLGYPSPSHVLAG